MQGAQGLHVGHARHATRAPGRAASAGGAGGALTDLGIEDNFRRDLGRQLPEDGAALFVLVRQVTPDKVLPRISGYGGKVLQTSLSNEAEQKLQEALTASGAPA